ncbi:DNA-directed RNA polymerase subunit beta' [Anaplasmataceae bacterium AB001_6]|nr:DNA-directed RNA polymerase subunit beta' [Anaplasmataceae bacterium AB001_6]
MSFSLGSLGEEIFDVYFGFSHSRFNAIKINIFNEDEIRKQSYGSVISGETINYRTNNPENGGLFCAKIFGSVKNFECVCGKYRGIKYKGVVCEKCGVEVTSSRVRRQRMGHIELADPVAHIWFLKSLPSRICQILDMTMKNVERILYFEAYVVLDSGVTPFKVGEILTEEKYRSTIKNYGEGSIIAEMGAIAIKKLLAYVDLEKLRDELYEQINSGLPDIKHKKAVRRLRLVIEFLKSGNKPQDMILNVIPVIPPNLRPLVMLEGGRFASSDLNALYRTVINRNNRLKNLKSLNAPDIVVNNEKRMLQEAVDALFDNSRKNKVIKGYNKRPYKSLSDMLKGKQGRFRQNLLGKRVDYSGRSVIVVGPKLKLNQCGLPKKIALELFKPFIYAKLEMYGIASTFKTASRMVQNERPEVWDILDEVIKRHPVLLNRAPTLHRISIQAFDPILIEGKAIQLHPLVCTAFNADFDGDQMAVHVPLSIEAQVEARILMMSDRNILNPSNGKPIIVPSKDIVLGIYYLTQIDDKQTSDDKHEHYFSDQWEVDRALFASHITLHTPINCRLKLLNSEGDYVEKWVLTTAGRLKIFTILPDNIDFAVINKILSVKEVTELVSIVYNKCGRRVTVDFCDSLMSLGFEYATLSGISFGKNDMLVPSSKFAHIADTDKKVQQYDNQYQEGLITKNEKYNKVIDAWQECTDIVAKDMMDGIADCNSVADMNSIYMMADSGARGSPAQIRQLAGMRGLMAKPSGEIMDTPITSNLREGQNVMEYFNSTHGARKGLADTALKTANSGYLTRRLVDVAQDSIVTEHDCGTFKGLLMKALIDNGNIITSLSESVIGRCSSVDVIDPDTDQIIIKSGDLILDDQITKIEKIGIDAIKIRSVLTCEAENGICARCYGVDLSKGNRLVSIGESIGVIAAQSVGEPGTQLTMRTFHVGGAATKGVEVSSLSSFCSGKVLMNAAANTVIDRFGDKIVINRSLDITIVDKAGTKHSHGRVPYGSKLYVSDNQEIKIGTKIADWDPYNSHIISEFKGKILYKDMIDNVSVNEHLDEDTGIINKTIVEWRKGEQNLSRLRPRIEIIGEDGDIIANNETGSKAIYSLPIGSVVNVENDSLIEPGDVIAKISKEYNLTRDITGGLPKVAELFEARHPKDAAIISDIDGYLEFGKDVYKSKRKVLIRSEDGKSEFEYLIPKGHHVIAKDGDFIKKGDMLVDGNPDPHDILRVLGVIALADYMISEIQHVYRLQGVKINNKHFEVIVRKMLQKVEITDAGDSALLVGEKVDFKHVDVTNKDLEAKNMKKVLFRPVLLGITKASLQTDSFISAASFQETTKVLTEAAVSGKIDYLKGLKENVIVGRLLPTGTGFVVYDMLERIKNEKIGNNEKISDDLAEKTGAHFDFEDNLVLHSENSAADSNQSANNDLNSVE